MKQKIPLVHDLQNRPTFTNAIWLFLITHLFKDNNNIKLILLFNNSPKLQLRSIVVYLTEQEFVWIFSLIFMGISRWLEDLQCYATLMKNFAKIRTFCINIDAIDCAFIERNKIKWFSIYRLNVSIVIDIL